MGCTLHCVATSETRNVSTIVEHQAMYPITNTEWFHPFTNGLRHLGNMFNPVLNPMRIYNVYSYFATAFSLLCSFIKAVCHENHGMMLVSATTIT